MSETVHIPQLRFPEFSGDWNRVKIQKLLDDKSIISHLDGNHGALYPRSEEFTKEGVPYVTANDFINGKVDLKKCKCLPVERASQFKKGIAHNGDVLFAHNATVGPVALLETDLEYVVLSTTATYYRCDNNTLINKYLKVYLTSNDFVRQYSRVMSQSTRNQVPITTQRLFYINLPDKPEQQKIAAFLTAVDNKIEQLIKKQELLGEYKKGLMQQIFSQAIRFKADDGSDFPNWEEKKLGDVVSTPVSDGPHLTPKFVKQGVPFLSVNNLVESKIDFSNVRYISIDDHLVFSKKCKPKKGDVLLGKAASVGKVAFVETDVEFNIWSPIAMIRPGNSNFSKYIYYCFQTRFILNQISKFTNSSSQGNIGMGDINKIIIKLPNKLEQTKIANLLSSIDSKIEQVGKQLRESKQFKKALLQQMFV